MLNHRSVGLLNNGAIFSAYLLFSLSSSTLILSLSSLFCFCYSFISYQFCISFLFFFSLFFYLSVIFYFVFPSYSLSFYFFFLSLSFCIYLTFFLPEKYYSAENEINRKSNLGNQPNFLNNMRVFWTMARNEDDI